MKRNLLYQQYKCLHCDYIFVIYIFPGLQFVFPTATLFLEEEKNLHKHMVIRLLPVLYTCICNCCKVLFIYNFNL